MASVTLNHIKKVYPHHETKKKKKGGLRAAFFAHESML